MDNIDDVDITMSLYTDLNTLDHLLKCSSDKINIVNYEKLFLTEHELFEDNIETYITHMENNDDTQLWEHLSQNLKVDEINHFMVQFLTYLKCKKDIKVLINIYTKLFNPLNVDMLPLITLDTIFNMLTTVISIDNWSENVTIIYMFLEMSNLLIKYVDWAERYENKYRAKININLRNPHNPKLSDIFITNISGILLTAWNFCENMDNVIDPLYIMNKSCQIQWYDKKHNYVKKYNVTTKLFYSILNTLRVGLIPICYRYKTYKEDLHNINETLQTRQMTFLNRLIASQKQQLELYFNEADQVIKLEGLFDLVNNFYVTTFNTLKLIKLDHDIIVDDIFNDMSFYMVFNEEINKNNFINEDFCNFLLDITLSKTYTNNISVKFDFVKIIHNLIMSCHKEYNPEIIIKFSEACMLLHNDIQQSHMQVQQQIIQQIDIYGFLTKTIKLDAQKYTPLVVNVMELNLQITKKMLHNIMTNLGDIENMVNNIYKEINSTTNNVNHSNLIVTKLEEEIYIRTGYYIKVLSALSKLIVIIIENPLLQKMLFAEEIFSQLATIINLNVNKLGSVFEYKINMNFKKFLTAEINIDNYVMHIIQILNVVNKHCDMTEFINNYTFNLNNYANLKSYVNNVQYDEIFEKLQQTIEYDTDDYPDEFLDPLTYSKIKDPCLIPGMTGFDDLYFDRSTIMKQLLVKEENPYTRAHLTSDEFEKYNELEEIKLKNKLFKDKMDNYKI